MTASRQIKTPTMTVPLLQEEGALQKGLELKKQLTRVLLSDVSCATFTYVSCQWTSLGLRGQTQSKHTAKRVKHMGSMG